MAYGKAFIKINMLLVIYKSIAYEIIPGMTKLAGTYHAKTNASTDLRRQIDTLGDDPSEHDS